MESVTRFWSHEAQNIRCVREADFDRVTAERDALQLLLNERDEQVHSLEQRRHAEQQACQAAERRAGGLETECTKFVEATIMACRRLAVCTVLLRSVLEYVNDDDLASEIRAALNPTAEAVSHDRS